ncbi:MAG: permease [Deltaproteobacteria bacterium]|jgi:cell division transport system permease protein|nr:permease [Deltaproteobacteria bacterium]
MPRIILRLIGQGILGLSINPWAQILTLTAVILVSFLVGLFLMAVTTLDHQLSMASGETSFQVYWRPGPDQAQSDEISRQWQEIQDIPGFLHGRTFTPEQALKEMESRLGRNSTVKDLTFIAENNPLPPTGLFAFSPPQDVQNLDYGIWIKDTSQKLWDLPGVEQVSVTPLRDELGQAWRKVNTYIMRPVIVFLTLLLGLIIGNTVRLALLSKSHEVEILQLVGAFNWYIRLPLLVCGAVQALAGSAIALVLLRFIHMQIRDVLMFPPLMLEIRFLTPEMILLMLAVPALMGLLGGWVGLKR